MQPKNATAMKNRIIVLSVLLCAAIHCGAQHKFTIGGYGEAVYSYNFYSDSPRRFLDPATYSYDKVGGYGRFDLPHVVIMMGYDFGRGWSMGTEIEFEHGGVEAAIELEDDEAIEIEQEIERGGEVALEQFWLQKSFCPEANIMAGMLIVPMGLTNGHHLPTEFFTVYRAEGENTIMPCTWHQIGVSFWGRTAHWRYEAMLLPGLNNRMFKNSTWIKTGAASAYEYTVGNEFAGVLRVDNYSVPGLRMGLSAYLGGTDNDAYPTSNRTALKGLLCIGSFDFEYKGYNVVARGNFDYGHLGNADGISSRNRSNSRKFLPSTYVGMAALAGGIEAGYDVFSLLPKRPADMKLYLFGRYEYYDCYVPPTDTATKYNWSDRNRVAFGINYYPIKDIVIKAEYSHRFYKAPYNNEPSFNIGIAYSGFFKR